MLDENSIKWQKTLPLNFFYTEHGADLEVPQSVESLFAKAVAVIDRLSNKMLSRRGIEAEKKSVGNTIRLEISLEKMNELLQCRQICVEDIRCLDSGSKQCLMRLCLNTCLSQRIVRRL